MHRTRITSRGPLVATAAALLAATAAPAAPAAPAPAADVLITNAAVYTVDASRPWAEAFAIRGGKITYVGTAAGARAQVGPKTKVIDLHGQYVQPGIVDIHEHPVMGGIKTLYECSFPFTATPDQIAATLKGCAAKAPAGAWIRGGQWGSDFFKQYGASLGSPREFLDRATGGRAVWLNDDSGHNGWVSTAALKLAKIDGRTAQPDGGTIVHGADGEPNGVLLETAARLMDPVLPPWSDAQYVAAAAEAVRSANAYGITSLKDAGAPFALAPKAFQTLDRQGRLTANVATCLPTPYGARSTPLDYAALERDRDRYASARVHTEFVKLFLDGVPTDARTAAMLHPYVADEKHGHDFRGELHIPPELLAKDVTELDRRGFTIKMHATGDWSVREALDAVASARKANGISGLHHEIAHAGYVDDADIPRFAQLDVVPDFCPILWYPSPIIASVVGAVGERGKHYWPTRALLDAGAIVATGSDWPAAVPDQNPWVGVGAMVTREDPRHLTPGAFWPEQAVRLEEAIRIYTINGARALRLEKQTGSIEVGKSADFVILDRNPFKVPPGDVGAAKPVQTWFEGRQVYPAAGQAPAKT
jgi:predicted amidohydrolase YtcJ